MGLSMQSTSVNGSQNSIRFDYGESFEDGTVTDSVVDILFVIEVENTPVADGFQLTNVAQSTQGSSTTSSSSTSTAQIALDQPVVNITKGIIIESSIPGPPYW